MIRVIWRGLLAGTGADQLAIGDQITIRALRNCLPPNQLRSSWLRISDGTVVSHPGDWVPGVDGCS